MFKPLEEGQIEQWEAEFDRLRSAAPSEAPTTDELIEKLIQELIQLDRLLTNQMSQVNRYQLGTMLGFSECTPIMHQLMASINTTLYQPATYQFLKQRADLIRSHSEERLPPELDHYLEQSLSDMRNRGLHLSDTQLEQLSSLKTQCERLEGLYRERLQPQAPDEATLFLTPEQLEGVRLKQLKPLKVEQEDGSIQYAIPTGQWSLNHLILAHCQVAETRDRVFHAMQSHGAPDNLLILEDLVQAYQLQAEILGKSHWAEVESHNTLLGSPEHARRFLDTQVERCYPKLREERAELESVLLDGECLSHTMVPMLKQRIEAKYGLGMKIRIDPKLALNAILSAIGRFYQMELTEIASESWSGCEAWFEAWSEDLQYVQITQSEGVIGTVILDLGARPGKFPRCCCHGIELLNDDKVTPVAVISMIVKDHLDHQDVIDLCHEFGHAIHHLLSKEHRFRSHDSFRVSRDFLEVPSTLLEHLAWEPKTLKDCGLPEEQIDSLVASRTRLSACAELRQLAMARGCLAIYTNEHVVSSAPLQRYFNTYLGEVLGEMPVVDGEPCRFEASFSGLVTSKSGYYCYPLGTTISEQLYQKLSSGSIRVEQWLQMLKVSSERSLLEQLSELGIDMGIDIVATPSMEAASGEAI